MIAGIDPGKDGAIAIGDNLYKMPTIGKEVNFLALLRLLNGVQIVYVEQQYILGRQSSEGNFRIGSNFGIITAACQAINAKRVAIRPKIWQKRILKGYYGNRGYHEKRTKDSAIAWCIDRGINLPPLGSTDRSKKYHDGCADARCILEYGLTVERQNGNV